jgi:hypothetical protein
MASTNQDLRRLPSGRRLLPGHGFEDFARVRASNLPRARPPAPAPAAPPRSPGNTIARAASSPPGFRCPVAPAPAPASVAPPPPAAPAAPDHAVRRPASLAGSWTERDSTLLLLGKAEGLTYRQISEVRLLACLMRVAMESVEPDPKSLPLPDIKFLQLR